MNDLKNILERNIVKNNVICLAGDNKSLNQIQTVIKSILCHNDRVSIYILNQDIASEWFRNIQRRLLNSHSCIFDIKLFDDTFKEFKTPRAHITYMAYARYYIPQLIDAEKVLY